MTETPIGLAARAGAPSEVANVSDQPHRPLGNEALTNGMVTATDEGLDVQRLASIVPTCRAQPIGRVPARHLAATVADV